MKIGYACLNTTLGTSFRTCRVSTLQKEGEQKLIDLTIENLQTTLQTLKWNIEHGILFYRMSSDIVPFASHPEHGWDWDKKEDIRTLLKEIKELQKEYGLRLSCHPGQYTVLNSPNESIVEKSISDLLYHEKLMSLTGGTDIILHIGGVYGDKKSAKERFVTHANRLPKNLRDKLRIENDDKSYHIQDVLEISKQTGLSVCMDWHHHRCLLPEDETFSRNNVQFYMQQVLGTWKNAEIAKIHMSSGREHEKDLRHHDVLTKEDQDLVLSLQELPFDVMIEAKKKEIAALHFLEAYEKKK